MNNQQKLIYYTNQILSEKGYHGTGINEILRRSNVSKGSLYYYFPSGKHELISESIKDFGIRFSLLLKKELNKTSIEQSSIIALSDFFENYFVSNDMKAPPLFIVMLQYSTIEHLPVRSNISHVLNLLYNITEAILNKLEYSKFNAQQIINLFIGTYAQAITEQSTHPFKLLRSRLA